MRCDMELENPTQHLRCDAAARLARVSPYRRTQSPTLREGGNQQVLEVLGTLRLLLRAPLDRTVRSALTCQTLRLPLNTPGSSEVEFRVGRIDTHIMRRQGARIQSLIPWP
jgi:hypothetical protein